MPGAFRYVDFWDGGAQPRKKWVRVDLAQAIQAESRLASMPDIFTTVQMFERSSYSEGERHICPLFFDLDHNDLSRSLEDAQLILQYLMDDLSIGPENILSKFSGKHGFHISVNPFALGVRPSPLSTACAKRAALDIAGRMGVKLSSDHGDQGTLDKNVYSIRRMLRVPNSVRRDGGKASVIPANELIELKGMETYDGHDDPATLAPLDWQDLGRPDDAFLWYAAHQDAVEIEGTLSSDSQRGFIKKSTGPGDIPVCLKSLLEPKLRLQGTRNSATFLMSITMKEMGWDHEQVWGALEGWTREVHLAETGSQQASGRVLQNARSTVRSAFTGDKKPVCKAILALGSKQDPVACQGHACPWVHFQTEVSADWTPPEISLSETRKPERVGRRATIKGTICQQDPAPYIVPAEVQMFCSCTKDQDDCPAKDGPKILVEREPQAILDFVSSLSHKAGLGHLREWCSKRVKARCKAKMKVLRQSSIVNASLQPVIDGAYVGGPSSFSEFEVWVPLSEIDSQSSYEMVVVPLPSPKTHQHMLIALSAKKIGMAHHSFKMNKDILERLRGQQAPATAEGVLSVLGERHAQYERMHGIIGRRLESIAMSLVWHSVLAFKFRGRPVRRGWLEALVVGDTAQGKTEMARGFMTWYGLGDFLPGENVTLAGLTAGVEQRGKRNQQRFGAFVRADTALTILDEMHEVKSDVLRGLSEVRSTGLVRMEKIASALAPARVRKLFLANAIAPGHHSASIRMERLEYGVEAVMNVMRSSEDTRRLDFAIGLKKKEELTAQMNSPIDLGCDRDAQADQELVLWAWSRSSDQVKFVDDCEDVILQKASQLSDKYYCSIPLVDPGEAKIKIARMACAVAASVFSADPSGEILEVKREHVIAACTILEELYCSEDLDLVSYAMMEQGRDNIDIHDCVRVANALHLVTGLSDKMGSGWIQIMYLLKDSEDNIGWTVNDLGDSVHLSIPEIKSLTRILIKERCIRKSRGMGFKLTNRGMTFARTLDDWAKEDGPGIHGRILEENKFGGSPEVTAP